MWHSIHRISRSRDSFSMLQRHNHASQYCTMQVKKVLEPNKLWLLSISHKHRLIAVSAHTFDHILPSNDPFQTLQRHIPTSHYQYKRADKVLRQEKLSMVSNWKVGGKTGVYYRKSAFLRTSSLLCTNRKNESCTRGILYYTKQMKRSPE